MAKKEAGKFTASDIMEGMISVRAVIRGAESGVNDRKIEKIIYVNALYNKTHRLSSYQTLTLLKKNVASSNLF